jgi:hypothetical protein
MSAVITLLTHIDIISDFTDATVAGLQVPAARLR